MQHLTRKDEFNVIILGLDNAGKTVLFDSTLLVLETQAKCAQTFLEKVKSTFTDTPGIDPTKIAPTIGQNSE